MNITEDYVSFETAALLREKGFQQQQDDSGYYATEMVYCVKESEDGSHHFCHQYPACCDQVNEYVCAPTIQMAMKWLREVYNLHCDIGYDDLDWFWNVIYISEDIPVSDRPELVKDGYACNKTYEEACESAIKYCLENLIN